MGLFDKKTQPTRAPRQLRWCEDLWREATGTPGSDRFSAHVMVQSLSVKAAWQYGSRALSAEVAFVGRLACEAGSMVEHISAKVVLDTDPAAPKRHDAWPDSLGLAFTSQYDHGGGAFPIFVVSIWTEEAGAQAFERAFDRALAAGHDHLPVWLDGRGRAEPDRAGEAFSVIQPLSAIRFGHRVDLRAAKV